MTTFYLGKWKFEVMWIPIMWNGAGEWFFVKPQFFIRYHEGKTGPLAFIAIGYIRIQEGERE